MLYVCARVCVCVWGMHGKVRVRVHECVFMCVCMFSNVCVRDVRVCVLSSLTFHGNSDDLLKAFCVFRH